ncbi:MAG: 16S rRNA (adenine(1518)-N(6)/adenine(1519)-N(6))-dimethyltransferase RsmA [Gemmatimonadaceae bacterium]
MPRGSGAKPPVLKRLGQHFLMDQVALEAIAGALDPEPGDVVVEIGAGRGGLTDILAKGGENRQPLIAIELDRALAAKLVDRYATAPNVTIVESDVLELDVAAIANGPFVVAGNVPYYITTPILFHVLRPPFPRRAVFLVQREVADRIVAHPGSKTYGALSVTIQAMSEAAIIRYVPAAAFQPPPKVESAVVRITPRPVGLIETGEVESFRVFVQGAFGMRRKQMVNVLRAVRRIAPADAVAILESLGIDPHARPETLAPAEFVALMRATGAGSE